jgi:hypothetical protein
VTGKNEGARGGFILLKWLTLGDLVDQTNRIQYSFSDKMKNTSFLYMENINTLLNIFAFSAKNYLKS